MATRSLPLVRSTLLWRRWASSSSSSAETSTDSDTLDSFVSSLSKPSTSRNFASMVRHSKFMQLGDFDGRLITGKIVHRVGDDLYIDLGLKFNAVCQAPSVGGEQYAIGSAVLMRLHDPELSERFLGSKKDLTLLEASATLIRLLRGPRGERIKTSDSSESPK